MLSLWPSMGSHIQDTWRDSWTRGHGLLLGTKTQLFKYEFHKTFLERHRTNQHCSILLNNWGRRGRVSKQNIFTPFFLKPKIVALADRLTTLACTPSGVGARAPLCREGADFVSLSIWDLGVSADFGYAEQAVRSNFTITLNLLLSFKRRPEFLQLFRRKLQRCFCGEAAEMFGGLRNSLSLSEHQRDPSSFSSSLMNRVLIHCCQMTFKNHVGIISIITQNKRWCLRCSVFTDTCNNFTFRSKMLNSIKAVWLRSWGFIARLNLWPFTLSQCIRKASHRVLFLRFPICESLLISAMVLWDSTARDTPVMLLQIDFSFLLSFQSDSVKYKLPA